MNKADIFSGIVSGRYSCRAYSPEKVSDADMAYILEQVRLAPSACNRQPWRIMIIGADDAEGREAVINSYARDWIRTAPVYLLMLGVPAEGWVRPFDSHSHIDVDVAIATEHLCLAAAARNLGTCWVCNFDPAKLRDGLHLDESIVPVAIVPLGHPAEGSVAPDKKRKELSDILIAR